MNTFGAELDRTRAWVDEAFSTRVVELGWHPLLVESAKHVVVGAGKALRPFLMAWAHTCLAGQSFQRPTRLLSDAGLALELVHSYSLVHDDLPAMDNDDFRRGRPTLHRLHGEAAAILAGDALLTGAFEILSGGPSSEASLRMKLTGELARAAGGAGMISGQVRDMFEGVASLAELERTHREKTGALFGAALAIASMVDNEGAHERHELARAWGVKLGLLFQIVDDVLDATAARADLGKSAGKDAASGKRTYVSLLGLEGAREAVTRIERELIGESARWNPDALEKTQTLLANFSKRTH